MMKTSVVCAVLLVFTVSAEYLELNNNFVEYGDIRPAQILSRPYPYQDNRNSVVVKTVTPPVIPAVYSDPYDIIPTATTEVQPAGLLSTAISCTYDAVKAVLVFLLTSAPALIAGTIMALGVCKLTSLCDSQITIYEAQTELRSFATPERLSRAAKFVREAVKKYNDMQHK